MNRKPSRFIAGICFLLYPILSYRFFLNLSENFTGNSGEGLSHSAIGFLILCLAALLAGIGVLANKPSVVAVGGILFFLGYYLPVVLDFAQHLRYWGIVDLLVWACTPSVIASLLLFFLCIARPAAKVLGIISGLLMLSYLGRNIILHIQHGTSAFYIARDVLLLAAFFLVGFAVHRKSQRVPRAKYPSGNYADSSDISAEAYCGLVKHTCLLVFTFGIWLLIWIYRTTENLNQVEREEYRNPTNKLLLCLFIPFYVIYWVYQSAQRIDKLAAARQIPSHLSTLCPILLILAPIVSPILMQEKINSIIVTGIDCNTSAVSAPPAPHTAPAAPVPAEAVTPAPAPVATATMMEELKVYKSLLELDIITEEEFNKRKAQLLQL